MTKEHLAAIRARADMAAGYEWEDNEDINADWTCPLCDGDGEIEGREYKHKELAGSVIAYGIGKGLKLCEEWVEFGPADTLDLLDEVERLRDVVRQVHALAGAVCRWPDVADVVSAMQKIHKLTKENL